MEAMPLNEMNCFVENLVNSYEARLSNIESIFTTSEAITETSYNLLKDFHDSLSNLRKEREDLNSQLRESLALNGSLRKKDYDKMMGCILIFLEEKEKETEEYFYKYIEDQKVMAQALKKGLFDIKNTKSQGNFDQIRTFKQEIENLIKSHEQRKIFVRKQFVEFQSFNNNIMQNYQELLNKGNDITIKDVKSIIKKLNTNNEYCSQKVGCSTGFLNYAPPVQPTPVEDEI